MRDYGIGPSKWADGWEGCFGNEPTVEGYVAHTLEVFEAIGHALREDGVIWWNIGDCYCSGKGTNGNSKARRTAAERGFVQSGGTVLCDTRPQDMPQSIRAGNKTLVPYRVALALQDAGWIIRQDPIWRKPSPMPESIDGWRWERCRVKVANGTVLRHASAITAGIGVPGNVSGGEHHAQWQECPGCDKCRDSDGYILRKGSWRPTTAHEFVFQIVRSEEYFCDAAAAQEPTSGTAHGRGPKMNSPKEGAQAANGDGHGGWHRGTPDVVESRNPRSVWTISSEAYKGKHFAAFPTMLAWKCIQASTSAGGCCAKCGSQYAPVVEKGRVPTRPGEASKFNDWKQDEATAADGQRSTASPNRDPQRHIAVKRTLGYRATCNCNAGEPVPCVVADPFTGSGTVLQVSINTGRQFFGSEIAEHYLPLIEERAAKPWAPKTEKRPAAKKRKRRSRERLLFG